MKSISLKNRCTPPLHINCRKKKEIGTTKVSQTSINSIGSNTLTMQAQSYAQSQRELIRSVKYSDLKAQNKQSILNSDFKL